MSNYVDDAIVERPTDARWDDPETHAPCTALLCTGACEGACWRVAESMSTEGARA